MHENILIPVGILEWRLTVLKGLRFEMEVGRQTPSLLSVVSDSIMQYLRQAIMCWSCVRPTRKMEHHIPPTTGTLVSRSGSTGGDSGGGGGGRA